MTQNAEIQIYKTRPDKNGNRGWQARIRISESAGACVVPKQKTFYTQKWGDRFSVWEEVDAKLTLENVR